MMTAEVLLAATAIPAQDRPRPQTLFRGSRILVGTILVFAGILVAAMGGLGVTPAPALSVLGVLHVTAAVGVWLDRGWGFGLAVWVVAAGVFSTLAGLVVAVLGLDPPAGLVPGGAVPMLAWTLFWYGVAAWGIQRTLVARQG